jgi:hypothetical protein
MTPGEPTPLLSQIVKPETFGFFPMLISAGVRFLRSPKGRAFMKSLRRRKRAAEAQAVEAKLQAQRSSTLEAHARAAEAVDQVNALAELEQRVKQGEIEESEVRPLVEEGEALEQEEAREGSGSRRPMRPLQSWVDGMAKIDQKMVDGEGGLEFVTNSPPGPGRLCRLPFYPSSPSSALSAVFVTVPGVVDPIMVRSGVDESGDDPICNLQIDPPFTATNHYSGSKQMVTRGLDYARFRILGLQTNQQPAYFADNNGPAPFVLGLTSRYNWESPPVITVSNLQTQNGRDLFVTRNDQQISASTFSILPYENCWAPPGAALTGQLQKLTRGASRWPRRSTRFFAGLRDNPVIDIDTSVLLTAQAWIPRWSPADGASPAPDTRLVIPFSADLIIEMVDDFVLGDVMNPSASARAGAQVRAGVREGLMSADGRSLLEVIAPRFVPQSRPKK